MIEVQTPKLCQLIINEKPLPLTQVVSYKIEENKKPIYGYNKKDFNTMIRGKTIVSGHIVIKKSMKDIIGTLIKAKSYDFSWVTPKEKIDLIYKLQLKNREDEKDKLNVWYDQILQTYTSIQNSYKTSSIDTKNDTFLDMSYGDNEIELKINFNILQTNNGSYEINMKESGDMIIVKNVHFISREGEISISKDSIDEVYTFVGNLGG